MKPASWSVVLQRSSLSFQMIPVCAALMSWKDFSWSAGSILSHMYTTMSVFFFSPHMVVRPLEAFLKKPGAATAVRPCILSAFVSFLSVLRMYLVGVRCSVASSAS